VFTNAISAITAVTFAKDSLPAVENAIPSGLGTYAPGAFTKVMINHFFTETGTNSPAVLALKPGTINTTSNFVSIAKGVVAVAATFVGATESPFTASS
jgi:hypothetical protein